MCNAAFKRQVSTNRPWLRSSPPPPLVLHFSQPDNAPVITDEWGEKSGLETEDSGTRFADSDPPRNEDQCEERNVEEAEVDAGNESVVEDRTWELKRCLADTVYGTELGFRARSEVRAEVLELVSQFEALNPTPRPVENLELLDGNWILIKDAEERVDEVKQCLFMKVRVKPGENTLVVYTAESKCSFPITGVSTYNVTPLSADPF